jgi:hypothetical protein
MLHTRTAIESRDGVPAVVPAIGVRPVDDASDPQHRSAAERALDEALADSFPASDPPSWTPGISRPRPADGFARVAAPAQDGDERLGRNPPRRLPVTA